MKGYAKKKPIAVEFYKLTSETLENVIEWLDGLYHEWEEGCIVLDTLEGPMEAEVNRCYIMKGNHNDVWAIRNDIFEDTYDIEETSE